MPLEYERKYRATPEILEKIDRDVPAKTQVYYMHTVYYDTKDGALAKRRLTLRCRRENDLSVCTLKTPEQDGARGEYSVNSGDIIQAIPELCKLSGVDLDALTREGLYPVCQAKFTRRAKELVVGDCCLELALDLGELLGGGRQEPLCEVEVELKQGSFSQADAYGCALARRYGLVPEGKSKFRRALALAKGER